MCPVGCGHRIAFHEDAEIIIHGSAEVSREAWSREEQAIEKKHRVLGGSEDFQRHDAFVKDKLNHIGLLMHCKDKVIRKVEIIKKVLQAPAGEESCA